MKKIVFTFFIILFLPIFVFAYSKYVIPGGETIGININTDGLIVVGFYEVNGEYIARKNINIGDKITKIEGIDVSSINELTKAINDKINDSLIIDVELIRKNKIINTTLEVKEEDNKIKTGLYIKDNVVGIGTLTYIDPVTKVYGSLGHDIILSETNNRVEVKDGNILMSKITSINKSRNGNVGSKDAKIFFNKKIGDIKKNLNSGIYGMYIDNLPKKDLIETASFSEIKLGEAYILTVTNNQEINKYKINILDKYNNKSDTNKAFSFEVVDNDLIKISGGIVQGMSGSPIIQNDKLIGAVTNVVIDNVKLGYGISIITMLEDGDSIRK